MGDIIIPSGTDSISVVVGDGGLVSAAVGAPGVADEGRGPLVSAAEAEGVLGGWLSPVFPESTSPHAVKTAADNKSNNTVTAGLLCGLNLELLGYRLPVTAIALGAFL